MSDPLGLISAGGGLKGPGLPAPSVGRSVEGPSFQKQLADKIRQVNELQRAAESAAEDVLAGRRDDVQSVILATEKANTAFNMLLALRNKVMDAYDEVKQIRV